jgi:hypothetical protein
MATVSAEMFPSARRYRRKRPIRLAAPTPALIVEWPTGVFYGNQEVCQCCESSEAEGFVAYLPRHFRSEMSWLELCEATEREALAFLDKALEWANHRVQNFRFHTHPGNRYCWHRCSFDLEFWPSSLAFPYVKNGHFRGWLTWPWDVGSDYDPRPWGASAE